MDDAHDCEECAMNEREALLRAICEHPDEDTPRLVFADWLQENGDDSDQCGPSSFVCRLHCRSCLTTFLGGNFDRFLLPSRGIHLCRNCAGAGELFDAHGQMWGNEIVANEGFHWGDFVRGFADGVAIATLLARSRILRSRSLNVRRSRNCSLISR